jgi:hypothetical protein
LQVKIQLHLTNYIVKEKMREKRPRITSSKGNTINQEQVRFEKEFYESKEVSEDINLINGKLPDIEFDELWHKNSTEQPGITDFLVDEDVKQSDFENIRDDGSLNDTLFIKDIYNTIDYDPTF